MEMKNARQIVISDTADDGRFDLFCQDLGFF